ncbi:MAG: 4-alpha-glucanotransferase [Burkholderiales bacterium]
MNLQERSAGVLLHITSLPGPHGIGDLGPDAFRFVDWLVEAGQRIWQVLPNTPIGPGDSPYQSPSAFAGSPLMVALEPLVEKHWLPAPVLPEDGFDPERVQFRQVEAWRLSQLRMAAQGFFERGSKADRASFVAWCAAEAQWLDDYALFMALQTVHEGQPWWEWEHPLRERQFDALAQARSDNADEINFWLFGQWCFDMQWARLKAYANRQGVSLLGDLPIFIAHHSADCWSRPDLYELEADLHPTVVAGVPPDAFSADGQRWGNPLYRWDRMAEEDFAWWSNRLKRALTHADGFRIDHFRGFAAYWAVPAAAATAIEGQWVLGPGKTLFDALTRHLGELPIIAEDLGLITPDVIALRHACGFPGMKVLQFAFGDDAGNVYLPHHHSPESVVYTGTHDNDTTCGWWQTLTAGERRFASIYLGGAAEPIHWAMIRAACNSVANTALFPMQDVLGLNDAHRMNLPGSASGNWSWRFEWSMVEPEMTRQLGRLTAASGRCPFALLQPTNAAPES